MCNICARCSKTMLVFWEILLSLSARRVWIEIGGIRMKKVIVGSHSPRGGCGLKSLMYAAATMLLCHSPRGGCGLKYFFQVYCYRGIIVTLREEGVD